MSARPVTLTYRHDTGPVLVVEDIRKAKTPRSSSYRRGRVTGTHANSDVTSSWASRLSLWCKVRGHSCLR